MNLYFIEYDYTFSYLADDENRYTETHSDSKRIRCQE